MLVAALLLLPYQDYCKKKISCSTKAGSMQNKNIYYQCCQLTDHTTNSTSPAKPPCLAQSRKEKVIFPL